MSLARQAVKQAARSQSRSKPLPAPVLGWVSAQNQAAAKAGTALVLENWFPTQTGIRIIGGSQRHATVSEDGEPCESLMAYVGAASNKLFAATDGNIIDITTPADPLVEPAAIVTGRTTDYYSAVNFATVGGNYMIALNGTDNPLLYDGTYFYPVTGVALRGLNYDAETAPFTSGLVLTGGTSGATGTIERVIDNGTTGTLWLRPVTGTFQDNETITDSGTGSATANGTASTLAAAITGVTTSTLTQGTVYRNRVFMVQTNSMNVWALPVDSIGGAAIQVSLAGVFRKGGSVLLTSSWSLDAGDGLDDKLVVVSTEGEAAVYQGSDPSDPTDWSIVGVYDCPPPLGKNGTMRAGGDLVVLTQQGAVPVSQIISKDPAALSLAAVSRAIEPDWTRDAQARGTVPWEIVKWPSRSMALVTNPVVSANTPAQCYIVNLETGAWCKRTGWDTRCFALHEDQVYFGTSDGKVMQADITGMDDGANYYSIAAMAWDHLGSPGYEKTILSARGQFITEGLFVPQLSVSTDYTVNIPSPPNTSIGSSATGAWDVGEWDEAEWDSVGVPQPYNTRWNSIGQSGYVVSAQVQVTNGSVLTPTAELVIIDILYETGEVML